MTIDADGAPDAYHPDDIGRDYLANAGEPGNWWAVEIPFIVLPGNQRGGARLGDFAAVVNRANGNLSYAILADLGPKGHLGEGSIALAEALGIDSDPRQGGTDGGVMYVVFPNSGNGTPRPIAEINSESEGLFETWGGMAQIEACFPE